MTVVGIKLVHYEKGKPEGVDVYQVITHTENWETDRLVFIKMLQNLGEDLIAKEE